MFQKTFKNLTFCPKKAPDGLQNQLVSLILEKYGKYHIESVSRLLNKKYFPYLFPCRGPVMLHFCSKQPISNYHIVINGVPIVSIIHFGCHENRKYQKFQISSKRKLPHCNNGFPVEILQKYFFKLYISAAFCLPLTTIVVNGKQRAAEKNEFSSRINFHFEVYQREPTHLSKFLLFLLPKKLKQKKTYEKV